MATVRAVNRIYEYTHAKINDEWPYGGLAAYTSYLADKLKPFIDQNYRTLPEPPNTAITGSSGGGLAAFYIAGTRPDKFGKAACFSPALGAGLDVNWHFSHDKRLRDSELFQLVEKNLRDKEHRPVYWLYWGLLRDGQFHNDVIEHFIAERSKEAVEILLHEYHYERDRDLFVCEDPVGGHEEKFWVQQVMNFMRVFFPKKG